MQCVILAGGLGTRMKSISGDIPKALLPVGPQTFIDWQLQWLKLMGVTQAILALGYGGEKIRAHLQAKCSTAQVNSLYPALEYRFDGKHYLGTGGAIKNAQDLLEDDFLVTYGDSFLPLDAAELFKTHRNLNAGATMAIYRNKGSGDRSNIIYTDGRIVKYDKVNPTSEMEYIDYGMSALKKSYFLSRSPGNTFDLATVLSQACDEKQLASLVAPKMFFEVGSPLGFERFCEFMAVEGHDLARLKACVHASHQS